MKCTGPGGNTVTGAPSAVLVLPGPLLASAFSGGDIDVEAAVVSPALKAAVPLGAALDAVSSPTTLVLPLPWPVTPEEVMLN
jgi:hypothetical protein